MTDWSDEFDGCTASAESATMFSCTGAPQLPAVADQLPLPHLPHLHTGEWSQDDQRAPQGSEGWSATYLPLRSILQPQLL